MGCDGGTIPRRDELVKTKKKPEAKDKDSALAFQWRCCSVSQQPLEKPIIMCGLGRLYNKLALIEALINRDTLPDTARHIKSLKDVRNLNLTPNPVFKDDEKKDRSSGTDTSPYICPVIGLEMSGKFRFVAIWSCGCVFSERALKEIKTHLCHKCQKPFTDDDVVILNGNDDDSVLMKTRLELRQKNNKKEKKIKVKIEQVGPNEDKVKEEDRSMQAPSSSKALSGKQAGVPLGKLAEKRKGAVNGNAEDTRLKKIKADYSIAKDPGASDVYKSLFTTHKSEKEQNRAHWVTYNPFYN